MNVCGVHVTDGWLATIVIGGSLILLGAVLWGLAEWSTRRYTRRYNNTIQERASWRPPRVEEADE